MSSLIPSLYYFLFFGSLSFFVPYLALYYQQSGFSGTQIGLLTGIAPLVTLVGGPFWTGLADSTRRHKTVMAATMTGAVMMALLIARADQFFILFGLVVLYSFLGAPIVSLADSATMAMLGEKRDQYGKIRLWGAVGWGLVAPIAGSIVGNGGMQWAFYGYAIGMGLTLLAAMSLHFPAQQENVNFKTGIRSLLSTRAWMIFLGMVLLTGIGLSSVNSYLFVYMESLGMNKTLMGLALTVSTLSEIPVMFFASRFLKRFKPRNLLILAMVTTSFRLLGYSAANQDWQVLLIQLVHGFTFPILWVAGVSYAAQVAPPGLSATAQGMFSSILMGFGAALGGLVGGLLLQSFSPSGMYLVIGTALLTSASLFGLAQRFWGSGH